MRFSTRMWLEEMKLSRYCSVPEPCSRVIHSTLPSLPGLASPSSPARAGEAASTRWSV